MAWHAMSKGVRDTLPLTMVSVRALHAEAEELYLCQSCMKCLMEKF